LLKGSEIQSSGQKEVKEDKDEFGVVAGFEPGSC
jgi:hypothetical protein